MEVNTQVEHINPYKYRLKRERVYLLLSILVTIIYYLWSFLAFVNGDSDSFIGPLFIFGFLILYLFLHFLGLAALRINSVKVGPNQFPEIWQSMVSQSERLGLKKPPDMYIVQMGGELNAFATRIVSRKLLVIFSDLAEALAEGKDKKQLDAVVAHELGHHVLNHTHFYNWFLVPADWVPFLSSSLSRAREYSADRIMKVMIKDQETCDRALIKLASGKVLGNLVNIHEYTEQVKTEKGFFVWLSEKLASHPHLPKRILALRSVN